MIISQLAPTRFVHILRIGFCPLMLMPVDGINLAIVFLGDASPPRGSSESTVTN